MKRFLLVLAVSISATPVILAQNPLDLRTAQNLAASADPRLRQLQLEADQSQLRLQDIAMERRPSLSVESHAQYQSETVELPFAAPGRASPQAPKDSYDASILVDQPLLDPSRKARIAAERARLAESQARIGTALYALRREVNEAFFTAAELQEREARVGETIKDLEARLHEAKLRVDQGVALPSEGAAIEIALLQRRQDVSELRANRRAALARLSELSGRALAIDDPLILPTLTAEFTETRASAETLRVRPEFALYDRTRDRLEAQKNLTLSEQHARVSAYGRAGYGKPGLNFLADDFHPYALAGIRLQWRPWDWGKSERERKVLALQQEASRADEEAFARSLDRSIQTDLAAVDRLNESIATDERIVALRELIAGETGARYDEHVVTAAEYIDKQTDVLEARLAIAGHRLELARAQANVLNLLGVEIR
ncbi:MAG: TolC family protein [Acidobacteriota bacterium]